MTNRKLRIAWLVGWGIAAVLLSVLWVRSYYKANLLMCQVSRTNGFSLVSQRGFFGITLFDPNDVGDRYSMGLTTTKPTAFSPPNWEIGTHEHPYPQQHVMVPWWSVMLLSAAFAAAPWLRFRYSLRTLLIVTMLVATTLGLGIHFWRR